MAIYFIRSSVLICQSQMPDLSLPLSPGSIEFVLYVCGSVDGMCIYIYIYIHTYIYIHKVSSILYFFKLDGIF